MQEPLSGFITVWSRLVEGSGSHMAWSEAIIGRLKGLMLSFALSLQYSLKLCCYTCKSTVWTNMSYLFAELCTSSYYVFPTDGLLKDFLDFWFSLTEQYYATVCCCALRSYLLQLSHDVVSMGLRRMGQRLNPCLKTP